MSTAKVCKKCSHYQIAKSWCVKHGTYRSVWDDWCKEKTEEWQAWKLSENIN